MYLQTCMALTFIAMAFSELRISFTEDFWPFFWYMKVNFGVREEFRWLLCVFWAFRKDKNKIPKATVLFSRSGFPIVQFIILSDSKNAFRSLFRLAEAILDVDKNEFGSPRQSESSEITCWTHQKPFQNNANSVLPTIGEKMIEHFRWKQLKSTNLTTDRQS